ncbi:hypothetical protein [Viridibacillus arvi]|uniref:hypothetical protein n=1 Tax=Viridibacillus arvi TaxID=263475 RepID=UPI003CFE67EE
MPNKRILYSLALVYSPLLSMNLIGTEEGKQSDPFLLTFYALLGSIAVIAFYISKRKKNMTRFAFVDILLFLTSGLITLYLPVGPSSIIVVIIALHIFLYWRYTKGISQKVYN